ncbi:Protein Cms1 [Arabidopsis thaliana x Arabidopsis arenosa]|uniref:Protein Cms1 n=1 Tax=Arabidopsis thaliana x Arabidopsis arenosa TaxID=1240361 RepID=A0A8T2A9S8_9BRAS|nr:Protein Cms1 [Arabidopsis thaliana x Arabidopsis arenosa]
MATTEVKPYAVKNPKRNRRPSLGPKKDLKKKTKNTKKSKAPTFDKTIEKSIRNDQKTENDDDEQLYSEPVSASEQLSYFLNQLESAIGIKVSSLELEPIKETCIVELSQRLDQDVGNLGEHIKLSCGSSWRETLCEGETLERKVEPGNPSVLVISSSALRSLELLRGLHSLTKHCPAVKLFSKHLKVEEQVSLLKKRVNIGSGTPNRIKKLIDIEALGLSRLDMIVVDMHPDVKGFSLFTLPQVRDEFWDLYKNCFHQRVLEGRLRICMYGPKPAPNLKKKKKN